jgi:death-on-curing protein
MTVSITWLTIEQVIRIHETQIKTHGGSLGLRDRGSLESALNRPKNSLHYGKYGDIPSLAAVYAYGITKNHPFIDGNKRTGFITSLNFLVLNNFDFDASNSDVVETILKLANNEIDEEMLVNWFRANSSEILNPDP